ncbi:argininosuccinate synthase [Fusarium agapanthi]|uniref:Argininosuccinate synthase n=1 Tax=Fusarium agapanthi TaxID=1803897 RepID=A0A9P5E958_9HYPO|nr:argininosuccinate synthase [Fusarium agapanthi]
MLPNRPSDLNGLNRQALPMTPSTLKEWSSTPRFDPSATYEPQDWSAAICNDACFSPEVELVEHAIKFPQRQVQGKVNFVAYKLRVYRWTFQRDSNLYSADESSMDTLCMDWNPQDTSAFIAI